MGHEPTCRLRRHDRSELLLDPLEYFCAPISAEVMSALI